MADKFKIYTKDYQSVASTSISQFLGVDYYTPQLSVEDYHAIDSKNFCYRGGAIQVRGGYDQLFDLSTLETTDGKKTFNGLYRFIDGQSKERIIAHIGYNLFEVTGIGSGKTFKNITFTALCDSSGNAYVIKNHRSYGFAKGKKLYIIDGEKYRVLYLDHSKLILENVEDYSGTYVPTTTIGIMSQQSSVSSREVLDDVNLLTPYRKNKIRTGEGNTIDTNKATFTYELDSAINSSGSNAYKQVVVDITQYIETSSESTTAGGN